MCLDKVDSKINKEMCYGVGWKVFTFNEGKFYGDCFEVSTERPRHEWLNEKRFRGPGTRKKIYIRNRKSYPYGWHIFKTRYGARKWSEEYGITPGGAIRCVEYKVVLATGRQDGSDVIVARWIRIGGPAKRKK